MVSGGGLGFPVGHKIELRGHGMIYSKEEEETGNHINGMCVYIFMLKQNMSFFREYEQTSQTN